MAWLKIVEDLREYLAIRDVVGVEVDIGSVARVTQANFGDGSANRIAFVPTAPVSVDPPRFLGEGDDGRRQLAQTTVNFDVCFAGYDADHPESEAHHMRACFGLWEVTAQSLQRSYDGAATWTGARWELGRKDGRHGSELIATLAITVPLFDVPWEMASPSPLPGDPKPVDP